MLPRFILVIVTGSIPCNYCTLALARYLFMIFFILAHVTLAPRVAYVIPATQGNYVTLAPWGAFVILATHGTYVTPAHRVLKLTRPPGVPVNPAPQGTHLTPAPKGTSVTPAPWGTYVTSAPRVTYLTPGGPVGYLC